ncbi:glyoxalase-like domain-containing protein [Lyophyllum atratum]|nr:glyoxalase-like domain-containing protein [Lyophyllum atratum]
MPDASNPSTNILDHIVHLTPPGSVEKTSEQFRELGFTVIPGGTHTDGLTANALVILADGVYLELISFTHPSSHYPAGSPERQARDSHQWASKAPGWIDFAFLGNGSLTTRISDIINERSRKDGSGVVYAPEVASGRERPDGKVLEWVISAPGRDNRGTLPFFCGDVTPRDWRVPMDPASNTRHPSTAQGILYILILAVAEDFLSISHQLTSVIGEPPILSDVKEFRQLHASGGKGGPRLILRVPDSEAEAGFVQEVGTEIYEVAFLVEARGKEGDDNTPYGRIVWSRA